MSGVVGVASGVQQMGMAQLHPWSLIEAWLERA